MNTRGPAPLDASLLARKGNAAPAIPDDPVLAGGAGSSLPPAGGEEAAVSRIAPMTGSRRGLLVLVSAALIAIVSVAVDRLIAPADRLVAAPAPPPAFDAPAFDAPAFDAPVAAAGPDAPGPEGPVPDSTIHDAAVSEAAVPGAPPGLPPVPRPVVLAPVTLPPVPVGAAPEIAPARDAAVVAVVPDAPPPPAATGRYILQLAAFSNAGSARGEASRLQQRLDPVLGDRKVVVVKAGSEPKPIYRLRASGYSTLAAARAACDRIRKLKTGCLVIRR